MDTNLNRGSATIYQFPVGGRAALTGHRDLSPSASDLATARTAKVSAGSGWYHEAAIEDAQQDRKR